MAKKNPVSVNLQTIFMIIPILDLYAAYRVEKLRKYLLFIISYAIVVAVLLLVLFPIDESLDFESSLQEANFGGDIIGLGIELIAIGISIVLIRKWSKEWNEQFENQSKEHEQ